MFLNWKHTKRITCVLITWENFGTKLSYLKLSSVGLTDFSHFEGFALLGCYAVLIGS
jgi:hypothetical protein